MQNDINLQNFLYMSDSKKFVLSFYLKLLTTYELKHNCAEDYSDVSFYFFNKMPVISLKKRIIRTAINIIPSFISLLILKTISIHFKRLGKFLSILIVELAASVEAKKSKSNELAVFDPTDTSDEICIYYINTNTLKIRKKNKFIQELVKPIFFKETHIPALIFLDPYLVNALNIISINDNTDYAHGCNYGWYEQNDIESFEQKFSNRFILPDINLRSTLTRYSIPPKKKNTSGKTLWIGAAETPMGLKDLIDGIVPSKNDFDWLMKVYQQVGDCIDVIMPHPSSASKEFNDIAHFFGIPIEQFDIRKVRDNDKFVFHSINCSLIYYCIKYDLDFVIYSTKLIGDQYTQNFKNFLAKLEKDGKISYF